MVLHTAIMWGWTDPCLTHARREYIAKAACRLVAYDHGYATTLAFSRIPLWYGSLNDAITDGENVDPLSPSNCGRPKYMETVEDAHPGYICDLYRYAERVLGPLATYRELSECINARSAAPGEGRPTLSISRRQLADWFLGQGGKEVSPIENPLLTTEHKEKRVAWAQKWFDFFCNPEAPVAFLDEKWFYTTNRRRKLKILPSNNNEMGQVAQYRRPRIRSRQYPVKVMYLGVVACPQPDKNFDGRVALGRVSIWKTLTRASRNKRFSVDVLVVEAIVKGDWKHQLVMPGMSVDELLESIKNQYDLDEFVSDRLVIGYETFTLGGNKK
jgi:hypothetical protein